MSDIIALESIQKFLIEQVASKVKLKKANGVNILEYKLVNPQVYIGYVPQSGYLPKEINLELPCIIVAQDRGKDDGSDSFSKIRLSFFVYNPGLQDENKNLTKDFDGYLDLVNLMELTRQELFKHRIINCKTTVNYPIRWGIYREQAYPYWSGWITFRVQPQSAQYMPDIHEEYFK